MPQPLDLDGDGQPEFAISGESIVCESPDCPATYVMRWYAREGCEILLASNLTYEPYQCQLGELIGPPTITNDWWDFTVFGIRMPLVVVSQRGNDPWHGPLGDVNNRYLGVRFKTTNGIHYGWIRLVTGALGAGVEEWAFETQPDTALRAGETVIPATNDAFAARIVLVGDYLDVTANNTAASVESGEPDHAGLSAGASLWWTWTAPTNGWLALDTTQSAFAPGFAVYRGIAITNLELVAFSPIKCPGYAPGVLRTVSQREIFFVAAGETYQITLDSPRSPYGFYDPTNAPRGQIRFTLVFSTLDITSPTNDATVFADSIVPVHINTGGATGTFLGLTLELDGQTARRASWAPVPPSPLWHLTNLLPGLHTLRSGAIDSNGRPHFSPPVQIQVRPANDDFSRAVTLAGTNLSVNCDAYYATNEAGELAHPAGYDGHTLWYRWTAPTNGVARIAIPTGGGIAVAVYRGNCLTNLEQIAANPAHFGVILSLSPLCPLLHFATRAGDTYAIQVSTRRWGPEPLFPGWPCDPPWNEGYPFQFNLGFVANPIGPLDLNLSAGFPPFRVDSVYFLFAAPRGSRFRLETSLDLRWWDEAASGTATGGTELIEVPSNLSESARFFRVRAVE